MSTEPGDATNAPALGRLDASWRAEYITRATADEDADVARGVAIEAKERCVFCGIFASGKPDEETHILATGDHVIAILNAYPYTSGHLMVMPRRHVGALGELTDPEHDELWRFVRHATGAMERAYNPGGMNVGANLGRAAGAGIPGHLHIHVLPRWDGDTNFMTSIAETRVVPESLAVSAQRLRATW